MFLQSVHSSRRMAYGFTLTEVLIIVAIMGVLVGASIPLLGDQLEKSRQRADYADLQAAKAAAEVVVAAKRINGQLIENNDIYWYNPNTGAFQRISFICGRAQRNNKLINETEFSFENNLPNVEKGIQAAFTVSGNTVTASIAYETPTTP